MPRKRATRRTYTSCIRGIIKIRCFDLCGNSHSENPFGNAKFYEYHFNVVCWYFGCENPIATKDERKHKTKCAGYGLLGTVDLIISSIVYVSVFNSNGFHSFKSHAHPFQWLWQVNGEFVSSIAALLNQLATRWRNQRPRTKSNIKSFYKCKTYNLHPGELKPQREKKHIPLNRKQSKALQQQMKNKMQNVSEPCNVSVRS